MYTPNSPLALDFFFFWVHSSYADLTAKNINDSSNTQLAELRNSVRNSDVPPMKKGAWNATMNLLGALL